MPVPAQKHQIMIIIRTPYNYIGMIVHIYNPIIWETEAGESQIQGKPGYIAKPWQKKERERGRMKEGRAERRKKGKKGRGRERGKEENS
jgi:hypothetical protein